MPLIPTSIYLSAKREFEALHKNILAEPQTHQCPSDGLDWTPKKSFTLDVLYEVGSKPFLWIFWNDIDYIKFFP
jgi:hypothetical protein